LKKLRILSLLLILLFMVTMVVTPIHAISNPDSIAFGTYKVFYNVLESNDMLFVAEGKVTYAVIPTDYSAQQAFIFDILDVAGTSTLASTPLPAFGDRPVGIYLTAARVTALSLSVGTAYQIRISGNPLIFASGAGNTVSATLASTNYVDQLLGVDNAIPTSNMIRNTMVTIATAMQTTDGVTTYLTNSQGYEYLTATGASYFLAGIPNLNAMSPILFQNVSQAIPGDTVESTGTYALTLTPGQKWGSTVSNGLTDLGLYLGINQSLAGSLVLFGIAIALAMFLYAKTQSGVAVLLLLGCVPFIGAFLGLMPIALAFIFVIIIVTLLGYFFFSRGAL
jgi:hypothetical protein